MAKICLITLTDDDLVNGSTPSWSVPNADPEYAAANVKDFYPQNVTKAGSASATLTLGGTGGTPKLVSIHNHNLVGRTVTFGSSGGYSQVMAVPARTGDGQCTNFFLDLREAGGTVAGSSHTIAISGGVSDAVIGRVCLPTEVYVVRWQAGRGGEVEYEIEWPNSTERTFLEVDITYDDHIRLRRAEGVFVREVDRAIAQLVMEDSHGGNRPFLFIPDVAVNDCWYAKPDQTSLVWKQRSPQNKVLQAALAVAELSMGLPED